MGIMVGSARVDERGKFSGGKSGDQLQTSSTNDIKGEVSQQAMYKHSKGWYILRPKKVAHAKKIAKNMVTACNNKNIGYSQSDREGILKYGVDTKTKVNCDCSSLVRKCIEEATGEKLKSFNTTNEASVLEDSGLFEKKKVYKDQKTTPVYDGDVLVTKTQGHTVVVTSGNPRTSTKSEDKDTTTKPASKKTKFTKYTGISSSIVVALSEIGCKDTSITYRKRIAEANGISNYKGSATHNNTLLKLLKQGKLIKP